MTDPAKATCAYCLHPVRVRDDGLLAVHYRRIVVSRRAVPTVGAGSVERRCAGSGRPPKAAGKVAG